MFCGRDNELVEMNKRYEKDRFECIVIYGRRRIGKTALINTFCKDKPTVFFSALNASPYENLEALSRAIYEHKNSDERLNYPTYRSYEDALDEITKLSENERMVLVIDEYPYLAKAEESISSRLQHMIDHVWQNGKLYLILCGSSMSFMENQVLGYESPLYGRRTAQFRIQPMDYREVQLFDENQTMEENALVYGITGGVPHYINKLEMHGDIDKALLQNLFHSSSYLFEEPENLLKQELREPAVYNSIITAIANGASKSNEIASKVGIESGTCAKYLKVLLELGIIRKETPIAEKIGKKTIYLIEDNFFRFWYRFVPKNLSAINANRFERIYDRVVKEQLSDYMGLVFEKMCREYLLKYAEELPIILSEVGQWWGSDVSKKKEVQIDIIGTPVEGQEYIIGSCKYKNKCVGIEELERLQEYAKVFGKGTKYYYYI
ncbi:MAG: ATP-binding protein, partial [Eubacteriales bacterium]